MTTNEKLFNTALEALNKLFADTSISQEKCKENLMVLRDEIDILLSSVSGKA